MGEIREGDDQNTFVVRGEKIKFWKCSEKQDSKLKTMWMCG